VRLLTSLRSTREGYLDPYDVLNLWKIISSQNNQKTLEELKGEIIKSPNDRMWSVSNDVILENGCDIFNIPSNFSAGAFSALFSFIARRKKFIDFSNSINSDVLTNNFSESKFVLEDAFPHSIIAIQIAQSSSINIFSDVCMLQGVGQWECKRFLYRTVIVGHVLLFLRFKSIIPESAWVSLASYSGTRLARMLYDPSSNFGLSDIQKLAFPFLRTYSIFEYNFISECFYCNTRSLP
jgi:hypothetical protein